MNTATKFIAWSCLAVFLFTTAPVLAQKQANDQPPATNAPVTTRIEPSRPTAGNILTSNQIAALLTEWTDEKSKTKLQFSASFGLRSVSPEEKRKYVKSGKIPIFIACQLDEIKDIEGKKLAKRMSGTAHYYILDPDGKVVAKQSLSLDKMCPSWGGQGGYFVEVAKEGEYTAVVWVDGGKKRIFGKKMTANLSRLQ